VIISVRGTAAAPGCRCSRRCAGCGARCSAVTADPLLKRHLGRSHRPGAALRSDRSSGPRAPAACRCARRGGIPAPGMPHGIRFTPGPVPTRPATRSPPPVARQRVVLCMCDARSPRCAPAGPAGPEPPTGRGDRRPPALTTARTAPPGPPRDGRARTPDDGRRPAPAGGRRPAVHRPSPADPRPSPVATACTAAGVRPAAPGR